MVEIECKKCGFKGTGHQVGRYNIPIVIIQCPKCCFIADILPLKEVTKGA